MMQTTVKPATKETDVYWESFEQFQRQSTFQDLCWLSTLRKAAVSRFAETGFPTTKDEDWRFTNVAPIARLPFRPILVHARDGIKAEALDRFPFSSLTGTRLVFVDGHYSPELSRPSRDEGGVRVSSLAAALKDDGEWIRDHLARLTGNGADPFVALNTAFFADGALIHVPKGVTARGPVQLLHISSSAETGATAHPRHLIVAEANSEITVIENYVSTVSSPHFTNAVTELIVGEGARVEHCKFQDEAKEAYHLAAIHAHLGARCNVVSHSFALGARLSRNNIKTVLAGEGVECVLNGLYLTADDQLADHHMIVEHAQPHCNSHEYFNGILDDRSKGVFHGRILVRPGAQKTDAKQTNKNLLLSDDASVDTKPQLEIYADDVKCTHGATVGQLNEESIFYLRARGIGEEKARRMLMHAFAGEIIDRIRHEPARDELDRLVWDRLEENAQISVSG
jgi:Fe-S cluster assembly protein SufD